MTNEKNEFELVELSEGILSHEPGEEVDDNILAELPGGIKMYEFRDEKLIELVEEERGYVQDDGNIPTTFPGGIKMFVPIDDEPIDDDPIFDQEDNGQENFALRSRL